MMIKRLFIIFGVLIITCTFCSCKSTPVRFGEGIQSSLLSNKTVFMNIIIAEWQRTYTPLMDAGIYNSGLNKIKDVFESQQKTKIESLQKELIELYINLFNPEIIIDSFPFTDEKFNVNYFTKKDKKTGKIDEDISKVISEICENNDAEYVFVLVGQMRTVNVATLGLSGRNLFVFEIALFDKFGNLVSSGSVETKIVKIRSNDVDGFISLIDQAADSLKSTIHAIGK